MGNDTVVRLGFKEYATITTIFLTVTSLGFGAMLFVVNLMITNHTDRTGIHQTPDEKRAIIDAAKGEWMAEVDLRIRLAMAEQDSKWQTRLESLEKGLRLSIIETGRKESNQ